MEKVIWSEISPDYTSNTHDASGLDTARGLLIGLAISQLFWVSLAVYLFRG